MHTIRVFSYIEALDAFLVTKEFTRISDFLGLTEWHPVVWVGRLFEMDNDVGEHWFDHWEERDEKEDQAKQLGIDTFNLMILRDDSFQDGRDGPCHPPAIRRRFWTDVLKSLELSYDLLFEEARRANQWYEAEEDRKVSYADEYIPNLEERIAQMQVSLSQSGFPFDAAEPGSLQ